MRRARVAIIPILVAACGEVAERPAEPTSDATVREVRASLTDEAYLVRLGLMRGHLLVGHELYGQRALAAARTHSKHPNDELYAGMDVEFAARGATGFAEALEAHALASEGEDAAAVAEAYAALTAAIAASEAVVSPSPAMIARVIVELLREAAAEYAIGVVDGRLANAHEYQDAYGFTQVASAWAARGAETEAAVFGRIAERIDALADLWPSLVPPDVVEHQAAQLYGAAADVEILALDLPPP